MRLWVSILSVLFVVGMVWLGGCDSEPLISPNDEYQYTGTVYDELSTEPIAGATVTMYLGIIGDTVRYQKSDITDSLGQYYMHFSGSPPVELRCSKEGYQTLALVNEVPVGRGDLGRESFYIRLDLPLPPEDTAGTGD
ncbi:hypothetical protein GF356_07990 [candidate division GN15 bacterium]|nr:hypothetical protein [candidate division GN15 bacterium]